MKEKLRILLLEDLPTDAELVVDELELSGLDFIYEVVENEKDFARLLENFSPDIVLSDYSLPTFNGMAALALVKERFPHIPVIMVTASINEETAVSCMRAGAADYILKDKMKRLGMAVRTVLENQQLKLQKQQAEHELQESGRYYRALLNQMNEHVVVVEKNFVLSDVNETFLRQRGYKRDEVIGKHCYSILRHNEKPCCNDGESCVLQKVFQSGKPERSLRQQTSKSGKKKWYNISLSPMTNSVGEVTAVIESSLDVTELIEAQEEIQKLSTAIEQSPVSVVLTDIKGNIEYVNPHFSKVTGYSREEALGQNPRVLKSGDQEPELYKKLWETITKGNVWHGEFHNKKKDGTLFWEDATIGPIMNDQNVITNYLAVKEDITEKKRLNRELAQAQKMEAVGRLAGGIAHDFNNLLTVINGYSEIMLSKVGRESSITTYIDQIAQAGKKAGSLTQQLLAFSSKQMMQPKVLNPNQTMRDIVKLLKRLIGENINLQLRLTEDLPAIEADPSQLDQIILNLAVNARDAMPDGGDLLIETKTAPINSKAQAAGMNKKQGSPCVQISVSDSGIGMDEATLAKIFEPFFTTKEKGKGTGLGMATVYGIVNQNGWHIEVSSTPNKGSAFHIYIPPTEKLAMPNIPHPVGSSTNGSETILFAEDDSQVRAFVTRILEQAGYTVLQASEGEQAIALANEKSLEIDLLLSDVVMPNMGGKKLAELLKQKIPDLKIIYISGYAGETISQTGVLNNETIFMQKPFSSNELLQLLRTTLDSEPASSPPPVISVAVDI